MRVVSFSAPVLKSLCQFTDVTIHQVTTVIDLLYGSNGQGLIAIVFYVAKGWFRIDVVQPHCHVLTGIKCHTNKWQNARI